MAGSDLRVPELRGDVDVRALPLTALDGFVLSRIDGRTTVTDIVAMTGLPSEQVCDILLRLIELGVARFQEERAPRKPEPRKPEPAVRPSSKPPPRAATVPPSRASIAPGPSSVAPRRRHSLPPPRRMLSESPISSPAPDLRSAPPGASSIAPLVERTRSQPPAGAARDEARGFGSVSVRPSQLPRGSQRPAPRSVAPAGTSTRERLASSRPRSLAPVAEALYDARELDEPVDLPRERRKQILDYFYQLGQRDYYQLLGVPYGAERKQIRASYFTLSKAFHPDSMFRKELGSFKAKMTAVFEALTEAYETLGKQQRRDEYDTYLRSTRSIADAERALSTEVAANGNAPIQVPRAPPLPEIAYEEPTVSPPPPPREVTPEARRVARELLEKRLKAGRVARREDEPPPAPEPAPVDPVLERQSLAKQLTRSLIDAGKVTGTSDKVTRAVVQAKDAFEHGDVSGAVQHVARALSFAPERTDLRMEHERLTRIVAEQLASDYAEHARFETKQGKWASAAVSWAKVCEGRPSDGEAHRAAAYALTKAGGDLRGAQKYAQQAVFLAPDDVEARILLAQIYLTVGLKLNARRELETAAKLDPQNEMVKNLFSELKG